MESKDYSWFRGTEDICLAQGPCELLYVDVEPSAANGRLWVKNGTGSSAPIIHTLKTQSNTNVNFNPPKPVYLDKGLFIDIDEKVTSFFVQWRKL